MNRKSGISLVVLVITIIVMIILTAVTVMGISNVLIGVYEDDFVTELTTIKDKVKEYNITTGKLPVDENIQYTLDNVLALHIDATKQSKLSEEITLNNDNNNTFYELDVDLLGIELDERGLKKTENDVFLITSNTMNVYYLEGAEIEDGFYFSTVKLIEDKTVTIEEQNNSEEVLLKQDIKLTKNTNVWTNNLSIKVDIELNEGETLKYSIAGKEQREVPEDKLILISESSLSEEEKTALQNNQNLVVTNSNGTTATILLDNLDVWLPEITDVNVVSTEEGTYNTLLFTLKDQDESSIKAMYYDYGTEITVENLIRLGKVSKDGKTVIVPKNVKTIKYVVEDYAGNILFDEYEIDDQYIVE